MNREAALGELGVIMGMSLPIITIPSTIIGSLCMILVPKVSSEKTNNDKLKIQIENYIMFSLVCLFAFIPIFIVLGAPLCQFVFNNIQSGIYLCYSTWIIVPMGIAQITTSILNALNQENKTFIYFVISSMFMITSIIFLPKFIGILAMSFAIGISNIILSILNLYKIKKLTNYSSQIIKKLIIQLLISLPVILITNITYNWMNIIFNKITTIICCGIISISAYVMLLFIFNILSYKSVVKFINKNLRKNKKLS
jgi:O-antigen/teichoic acid export membrane protein